MKFHRGWPDQGGHLPLVNKGPRSSEPITARSETRPAQYDAKASIGKRYARMTRPARLLLHHRRPDQGNGTVTVRDPPAQERIDKSRVVEY